MKIIFRYSMLFTAGLFYSIAWRDILAKLLDWNEAWLAVVVAFAVGSLWLCRLHFSRRHDERQPR